jgi:hypothetical protein
MLTIEVRPESGISATTDQLLSSLRNIRKINVLPTNNSYASGKSILCAPLTHQ